MSKWFVGIIAIFLMILPLSFISAVDTSSTDGLQEGDIIWKYWNTEYMLNKDSEWIGLPDLDNAPILGGNYNIVNLSSGEDFQKSYGFVEGKAVYIYLNVIEGNLEIFIDRENGTALINSTNVGSHDEYFTFTPDETANYQIRIETNSVDQCEGELYVRQNLVFAGTKMNATLDTAVEDLSTVVFRVDQDFEGIEVNSTGDLVIANVSIISSITDSYNFLYLNDTYTHRFYENTYIYYDETVVRMCANYKYKGVQTLQYANRKTPMNDTIAFANATTDTYLSIVSDRAYVPQLQPQEEDNGFPAGSIVVIEFASGADDALITVNSVKGEENIYIIPVDNTSTPSDDDSSGGGIPFGYSFIPFSILTVVSILIWKKRK